MTNIFFFSNNVLCLIKDKYYHMTISTVCRLEMSIWTSFKFLHLPKTVCIYFKPFLNNPWFFYVSAVQFFKTLLEKEKFSFALMFSTRLNSFLPFSLQITICCLQTLSFWKSLKFVIWKRVKSSITYLMGKKPLWEKEITAFSHNVSL